MIGLPPQTRVKGVGRHNKRLHENKCVEIRVEGRDMVRECGSRNGAELEIDREDIHDRKIWRRNVMKSKSNPIGKRTTNR